MCCDWQDQLCGRDPTLTDDVVVILNEFTQLSKMENSKVSLCARQVRTGQDLRPLTCYTIQYCCYFHSGLVYVPILPS